MAAAVLQQHVSVYTVHHHAPGSVATSTNKTLLCRQYGKPPQHSVGRVKLQLWIFVNGVLTEQTIEVGPSAETVTAYNAAVHSKRQIVNARPKRRDEGKRVAKELENCDHVIREYLGDFGTLDLTQHMVSATVLRGDSIKAKVLCAAHNSATIQALQTRRTLPSFLRKDGITKETLNNPLYCPVAIDMLKAIVWQSMLLNPDAVHVSELFGQSAVGTIDDAADLWRSHDVTDRLQDADDSGNFIQASTGMYDVSKLLPRRAANPVSVVNCIKGTPYFEKYNVLNEVATNTMRCTHEEIKGVVDRTFPELKKKRAGAADFVLRDFWHKSAVKNLLCVLKGHLTQGQSLGMSSSNGTMVDELVKVMEQVRLKAQGGPTQQGLTYTDCIDIINEAPQVCKLTAMAVESITHSEELEPANEKWLSVDTPSFQFGLLYKGGKFLGIHPDVLSIVDDNALHAFELKTKWMLDAGQVDDISGNIPSGTYRDHVNQCITQGISSTVAYGRDLESTTFRLCIVAIPYEATVGSISAEIKTGMMKCAPDSGSSPDLDNLAKDMYTSIIAGSTFANFKDNAFYGYTDKTYTVSKKSELILWVIASMRQEKYDRAPLLYCYDNTNGDNTNGQMRPLKKPTLAQLGLSQVEEEREERNLPHEPVYLQADDIGLACWVCPMLAKEEEWTAVVAVISVNGREVQTAEVTKRLRAPGQLLHNTAKPKVRGQNAAGTVQLLHLNYKDDSLGGLHDFDLSAYSAPDDTPVCFLFPEMQKGPTGVYHGVTFVSNGDNVELFDIPEWFQSTSAKMDEFVKPLAKYGSVHDASAKGKKKLFRSLFPSCELLDIDVMLSHIEDTSILTVYSLDDTTSSLLVDVQNAALMWYQQKGVAEKQWPFNIVRRVPGIHGTDADSIVIHAQPNVKYFPTSLLAPYQKTFQVYTQAPGFKKGAKTREYTRETNAADGQNVLNPGLTLQMAGKRSSRPRSTAETVENTVTGKSKFPKILRSSVPFYEFIRAVLPQTTMKSNQTAPFYTYHQLKDGKGWYIGNANPGPSDRKKIYTTKPYLPDEGEQDFFEKVAYPHWRKDQPKPTQTEWQLVV